MMSQEQTERMVIETNSLVKKLAIGQNEIKEVLIGNEFHEKGLIKEVKCNKDKIYKLEDDKKRGAKIVALVGSIVTLLSTLVVSLVAYFSK